MDRYAIMRLKQDQFNNVVNQLNQAGLQAEAKALRDRQYQFQREQFDENKRRAGVSEEMNRERLDLTKQQTEHSIGIQDAEAERAKTRFGWETEMQPFKEKLLSAQAARAAERPRTEIEKILDLKGKYPEGSPERTTVDNYIAARFGNKTTTMKPSDLVRLRELWHKENSDPNTGELRKDAVDFDDYVQRFGGAPDKDRNPVQKIAEDLGRRAGDEITPEYAGQLIQTSWWGEMDDAEKDALYEQLLVKNPKLHDALVDAVLEKRRAAQNQVRREEKNVQQDRTRRTLGNESMGY